MERRKGHGVAVVPSAGAAKKATASAIDQGTTRPPVIIYGAEWCGPCHQAAAYLRQRGIQFVEKDIVALQGHEDRDPKLALQGGNRSAYKEIAQADEVGFGHLLKPLNESTDLFALESVLPFHHRESHRAEFLGTD